MKSFVIDAHVLVHSWLKNPKLSSRMAKGAKMAAKKREVLGRIVDRLQELSEEQLGSVADYVVYLSDKAAWEETQEILSHRALVEQIRLADEAWTSGKMGEYEDWDKIREGK